MKISTIMDNFPIIQYNSSVDILEKVIHILVEKWG